MSITVKTDIRSKDEAGKWGYWGKKSQPTELPMAADPDDEEGNDLPNFIETNARKGIHEMLTGSKYRPFADLDLKTEDSAKMKANKILRGRQIMEEIFPDGMGTMEHESCKDGKISGHYTVYGIYYTDMGHIKYLIERWLEEHKETWDSIHFDPQVYNKNHLLRVPLCSKVGEDRPLVRCESKVVGGEAYLHYPEENVKDSLELGLVTYCDADEEMDTPEGYVAPVEVKAALLEDENVNWSPEQKATALAELRRMINAISPARAADRKEWFKGVVAIRRVADKHKQLLAYLPLAHEFASKTDRGNYDKTETEKYYENPGKYLFGYKTLKDWADADTPGWNEGEAGDFTIKQTEEFDIDVVKRAALGVRALDQIPAFVDAMVTYMNHYFTFIAAGMKPFIVQELMVWDEDEKKLIKSRDYSTALALGTGYFSNKELMFTFKMPKKGDKDVADKVVAICPLKTWMKHPKRNEKMRLVFDCSPDFDDKRAYNLFDGLAIKYDDCKNAPELAEDSPYLQHILKRLCDGDCKSYNYVLDKMALQVQRPWIKHKSMLGVLGEEGAGKGLSVQPLFRIIGKRYVAFPSNQDQILGKFNTTVGGKLIIFLDELTWGGDKQREGALKKLITETETQIEPKGRDPYPVKNPSNLIAFSNEDWMVAVGRHGRRAQILRSNDELSGIQTPATRALIQDIVNTDIMSIARFFYERDITNFNPEMIVVTDEMRAQKVASMGDIDKACLAMLQSGVVKLNGQEHLISGSEFKKSVLYDAIGAPIKYMTDTKFWIEMRKMWPGITQKQKCVNRVRSMYVCFPDLSDMRKQFQARYKDDGWTFDEADRAANDSEVDEE